LSISLLRAARSALTQIKTKQWGEFLAVTLPDGTIGRRLCAPKYQWYMMADMPIVTMI
jgi:hypothetical protein